MVNGKKVLIVGLLLVGFVEVSASNAQVDRYMRSLNSKDAALLNAAYANNILVIQSLLKQGANPNVTDYYGNTPVAVYGITQKRSHPQDRALLDAAYNVNVSAIKNALNNGANVLALDFYGQTYKQILTQRVYNK